MLQVHVVTAANRDLYRDQLDACLRWRCRFGADGEHGVARQPPGRTVDEYDTDDATYLLAFRHDAFVAASRLRPFSAPTLLADGFPHLASFRGVPHWPNDAEWTRMFVVPGPRRRGRDGVAAAMGCAVMEYCLDAGIRRLCGIQEVYWLPRWADYGWRFEPLGLPGEIDGVPCLAGLCDVTPEALADVRHAAGLQTPQIVQIGPLRDFVTGRVHPAPPLDALTAHQLNSLPKVP